MVRKMSRLCNGLATIIYLLNILYMYHAQEGSCTMLNSCKCTYRDGAIVNLAPLAKSDGTARFADVPGKLATTIYSWNPCKSFTEGTCENVAVCQIQEDLPPAIYKPLGSQDSAKFTTDDNGNLAIQYEIEQKGVLTTTLVTLICDQNTADTFRVKDEKQSEAKYVVVVQHTGSILFQRHSFFFPVLIVEQWYRGVRLTTHQKDSLFSNASGGDLGTDQSVCLPNRCYLGSSFRGHLPDHYFLGFLALFFIVGITIQKYVRKKSGKSVVPFVEFWMQLPGLVKAGVLLIVCKGKRVGYETA